MSLGLKKARVPTVQEIIDDPITKLAADNWATSITHPFDQSLILTIHSDVIRGSQASRVQLLEFSGYLENYLWKYFSSENFSNEHVESIVVLFNEKFKEASVSAFGSISPDDLEEKFELFFTKVIGLLESERNFEVRVSLVTFLINAYQSLENPTVRKSVLKYFSLSLWESLSQSRRARELESHPNLRRHWEHHVAEKTALLAAKAEAEQARSKKRKEVPRSEDCEENGSGVMFFRQLTSFIALLESGDRVDDAVLRYLERFSELVIDLISQLPTRRFLNALLDDMHFVLRCRRSALMQNESQDLQLLRHLIDTIESYTHFEVDDQSGNALSAIEVSALVTDRVHNLQQTAFQLHPEELSDLIYSSTGELSKPDVLRKHFFTLDQSQLIDLASRLGYLSEHDVKRLTTMEDSFEFVTEVLLEHLAVRKSQVDEINRLSLYPTETLLWDPNQIPLGHSFVYGARSLALPKLNLQFLTIHDYLWRNFVLYRLESAYEVRQDIVDSVKRMTPRVGPRGATVFGGWARMAVPISKLTLDEVGKPLLGEITPRTVTCSVEIDLARYTGDVKAEWEDLRDHDVVFLITIDRPAGDSGSAQESASKWEEESLDFPTRYGVRFVRGGEIFEVRDQDNVVLNDFTQPDERPSRAGTKRRLRIRLDPNQYFSDAKDEINCYDSFNLIVRRKPEENNFKAILETLRDLMTTASVGDSIPRWLHDVLLGYGSPSSANYKTLLGAKGEHSDYVDTFLDPVHLVESFSGAKFVFERSGGSFVECNGDNVSSVADLPPPPYKLSIQRNASGAETVIVHPYSKPEAGPFPEDESPRNTIRFTPTQVESIRSGLSPGLTAVIGPPGTGKTDVAVQIIAALYHSNPTQKILLVTHSNAALNDLFEKIMKRDIDPRHLLRLGSGERELSQSLAVAGAGGSGRGQGEHFSKQGRVNWSLERRMQLLGQVQRLAVSLGIPGDMGYTCETASYFYLDHVQPRVEAFEKKLSAGLGSNPVSEVFPFSNYFTSAPKPIFTGSEEHDLSSARGCVRHVNKIFEELNDYRAFELLKTQAHRSDYLLTKQARIVAMTCTHAAMTRRRLVELDFRYDSLIMEEAAQVLEVETLIPMLLQKTESGGESRLKRVVLIGDHQQLPPVVKHLAFQKYSKLDQSMFSRFIRLGVPSILLDKQGRARAELASLYRWRYCGHGGVGSLGDLSSVVSKGSYSLANAGFEHTFQLIDVPNFKGKGESSPTPFFYQNLGEAEYVVAVYQFMRLLHYPAEKISILTTYNGQKSLIRDIVNQRCLGNPLFGAPADITTVDKFQGQQNDYVLLSLVRTETVGHLRDVRRLVVAMSRARLGLYVFCRRSVFESCYELSPAFCQFLRHPTKLRLVVGEDHPTRREAGAIVEQDFVHSVDDVSAMGILVFQMVQHLQNSGSK